MSCNKVTVNLRLHWVVPNDKMSELVEWLHKNSWEFKEEATESIRAREANHVPCHTLALSSNH